MILRKKIIGIRLTHHDTRLRRQSPPLSKKNSARKSRASTPAARLARPRCSLGLREGYAYRLARERGAIPFMDLRYVHRERAITQHLDTDSALDIT
jgi:hypothetical protein